MPNPFFAILLLIGIFCFFLCVSFLLNILYHYKANNNQFDTANQQKNQNKSKIYHPKRVNKYYNSQGKKPDIALKNKILISNNTQFCSKNNINKD